MKNQYKIILSLMAFAVVSCGAASADEKPAQREGRGGERRARLQEHMASELGLTADQEAKSKAIRQEGRKSAEAILADATLTREQKREQAANLRKANEAAVDAVLTPEQRTKAADMREKAGKKMKERREKRGQDERAPGK